MRMLLFMYTPTSKKHHTYYISSVKRLSQSICNKNPNKGTSTLVKCPKIMLDLSLMCFHVLVISTISPSFGIGCREERFDFHQGVVHLLGLLRKSTLHRLINFLSQTQNVLLQCRLERFFSFTDFIKTLLRVCLQLLHHILQLLHPLFLLLELLLRGP